MTLGTLGQAPPPIFKQGPSALSKLIVFSALALLLMVTDARFKAGVPLRTAMAAALYPVQWLVMQPLNGISGAGHYFQSLHQAQVSETQALERLAAQAGRSLQVEQLALENQRLRQLLTMRERVTTQTTGAQVLYDTADPYTRKVVIDRGQTHGILPGSPVIDDSGVLGQVTRVYPLVSEVTLLVDRDQAVPVLNVRTGVRGVAYGQPSASGDGLELRYTLANADIEVGDLLTTSGVDGVYPPGLPVARVRHIERRAESSFTRIGCEPMARVSGALHVMVLTPVDASLPPSPLPTAGPGRGARPAATAPTDRPGNAP